MTFRVFKGFLTFDIAKYQNTTYLLIKYANMMDDVRITIVTMRITRFLCVHLHIRI